ncbi:MAG: hypothetical protein ACE5JH_02305, partial [Acidobacteriota bacterium]
TRRKGHFVERLLDGVRRGHARGRVTKPGTPTKKARPTKAVPRKGPKEEKASSKRPRAPHKRPKPKDR